MAHDKILVVDDEKHIRDLFSKAFEAEGYTVFCAADGKEALEIYKREHIFVIFLDLKMPGMNGIEVCKKIREDSPLATIIAVTGYTSIYELSVCKEAGFDDYFPKPVKLELLVKTANHAFEKLNRWKTGGFKSE